MPTASTASNPASSPTPAGSEISPGEGWFEEHVAPHEAQLKSYLRQRYPSVRDVDDVVQDSYLRIWKHRFFIQVSSAKAYLFRIARNRAIDGLRADQRALSRLAEEADPAEILDPRPDAAEMAASAEELTLLLDAIDSLPRRCRDVFILRQLQGCSTVEIAKRLGISAGTVQIHGALGVRRCEEYLRQRGVEVKP